MGIQKEGLFLSGIVCETFIVFLHFNRMRLADRWPFPHGRESNTPTGVRRGLASVEKRSARIMSFRRIMRERSRRARQSVSFTCRGRFNYPIASSPASSFPSLHPRRALFFLFSTRSRAECARASALSSRQERENAIARSG